MKKFWIFIIILSGTLLYGCNSQPIHLYAPDKIGNIYSRGIITDTAIEEGSTALFNASGGISLTNQAFTFNGTNWENEGITLNINTSQETKLTALYPAYNDEKALITENPYTEGALEDVLIAQSTFTNQTDINLSFTHFFAMLTIHVKSPFKESLTGISVKAPKVTSINPVDGTFTTSDEHTTRLDKNDTGAYSFIIPPMENCNLTLTFTTAEEDIPHSLTHTFQSGYNYECDVTNSDTRPGIRTVDDLIDFSLFINGKSDDRPWSDFGYIEGEDTIYCLLNDITITTADATKIAKLYPIGYYEAKAFKNTFDGKGHTISNLTYPEKNTTNECSGLFGYIGSNGVVKDLHLEKAKTLTTLKCKLIGGIATYNHGLIINCSVQNSTFHAIKGAKIGGICSRLSAGYIVNCYTSNDTINSNEDAYTGGLVGDANGYILNCYTYKNVLNSKQCKNSKNGGLVGTNSPDYKLTIANCYVNHSSLIASNSANAVGQAQYVIIDNFMYNLDMDICLETSSKVEITNEKKYPSKTFSVNGTHISTILNNWIDNPNRTEYTEIPFKHWTNTNPPTFTE